MIITFIILNTILALATLIPIWRHEAWWVRGWDFPRLQLLTFSIFILIAELIFLEYDSTYTWIFIFVTFACFIYHLTWILPYTKLFPVEVKASRSNNIENHIRIMTANVLTTNKNSNGLLEKLIVLENEYKYTMKCPLDNFYGMHVYSKLQLEDTAIQFLVEDDVPSMHALVILRSGKKLRVHFLHPAPPSPTENEESSERDAEILVVAKSVSDESGPIIVTGDLNDVAWSATTRLFRKISGLLDPRVGRGMFNTFHAKYWFARWPLDHLFHSEHFTVTDVKRLPYFGSDHFPILVDLLLDEAYGADQEGLEADADDHEWAEEKMNDHSVEESHVHEPGK
jgi:endonuclease/exonuclease/phosphatase (EEP) superfamily protein YafD